MKLKEGDIFSISVGDKGYGIGQIVKIPNKESLSIVIYKELLSNLDKVELSKIVKNSTPLFFGNTFDAKFYHKHWKILGNDKTSLDRLKLPYYKIGSFLMYVEDFDKKKVKRASKQEKKKLMVRKYVAPVRLENALLAHYGLKKWEDELFNPLLYSYNIESNNLINNTVET